MKTLNWVAKLWAITLIGASLWRIATLSTWANAITIALPYFTLILSSIVFYTLHFKGRRGAPKTTLVISTIQLILIALGVLGNNPTYIVLIFLCLSSLPIITILVVRHNMRSLKGQLAMHESTTNTDEQLFKKIWHLPEENSWKKLNLMAMKDVGDLRISDGKIKFIGVDNNVEISNIQKITFGKQGRDFINNWVKVEYDDGKTAFFADGRWLGWKGLLGGTKKIQQALQQFFSHQEIV